MRKCQEHIEPSIRSSVTAGFPSQCFKFLYSEFLKISTLFTAKWAICHTFLLTKVSFKCLTGLRKRTELMGSRGAGAYWLSTSDTNHSRLEWIEIPEVCPSVSFSEEILTSWEKSDQKRQSTFLSSWLLTALVCMRLGRAVCWGEMDYTSFPICIWPRSSFCEELSLTSWGTLLFHGRVHASLSWSNSSVFWLR